MKKRSTLISLSVIAGGIVVIANAFGGGKGLPGSPLSAPYETRFDTADALDGFTLFNVGAMGADWKVGSSDADGDTRYFVYCDLPGTYFQHGKNAWMVTPPISLDGGYYYLVDVEM